MLCRLKENSVLPWCCLGDFKEVLQDIEHEGGDGRSERQIEGFQNVLRDCALKDMAYVGNKFTWATTRGGSIKVQLDQALATQDWLDLFLRFRVVHLKPTSSGHIPILLE